MIRLQPGGGRGYDLQVRQARCPRRAQWDSHHRLPRRRGHARHIRVLGEGEAGHPVNGA